jgi:hypothetical protein
MIGAGSGVVLKISRTLAIEVKPAGLWFFWRWRWTLVENRDCVIGVSLSAGMIIKQSSASDNLLPMVLTLIKETITKK